MFLYSLDVSSNYFYVVIVFGLMLLKDSLVLVESALLFAQILVLLVLSLEVSVYLGEKLFLGRYDMFKFLVRDSQLSDFGLSGIEPLLGESDLIRQFVQINLLLLVLSPVAIFVLHLLREDDIVLMLHIGQPGRRFVKTFAVSF